MSNRIIGQAKRALKLLLELVLFSAIVFTLAVGFSSIPVLFGIDIGSYYTADNPFENPYLSLLISYLPLLLAACLSIWLVHRLIYKRSFQLLGLSTSGMWSEFMKGGLLSLILLSSGFLLLWSIGQMRIEQTDWNPYLFIGFALFFLVQSSLEEIIARAYLIPAFEARFNTWVALIGTSVIFSLVHGSNENVSTVGLINIFIAGFLMGLLFIKYRKIWAPIGLHAGWNFLQGSFFGFEVSGIEVYSFIDSTETGNDFFTGGAFGFEGSFLATLFLTFACFMIWRRIPSEHFYPQDHLEMAKQTA